MSSKRGRVGNKPPGATPPDTTSTDPVNCEWDTCIEQFSCITDLVQHIKKTHICKGIMKDNVCLWRNCPRNKKPYQYPCRLVAHLQSHSGEKPHKCPYLGCTKIFSKSDNLKMHIRRHIEEKPYTCKIPGCRKSFNKLLDYSQHQKTHTKQFASKRKRFGNNSPAVTSSDTTYTDQVNCQWDTCIQQFSCITDLVQHIKKTHMLKEITKDNVCLWRNCLRNKKPFKVRKGLVTHLRSHSRKRPNKCHYQGCNKTFVRSDHLKVHIQRRHSGEKPYKCKIQGCNKSFSISSDLTRHQNRHSKQKSFACTFPGCDKRYCTRCALKKHTKNHTQRKKPETPEKPLNKKCFKHHNKEHHQLYEVEEQATPLIAGPPEQHPYHANKDNGYLQLSAPEFMNGLPASNTIFDVQELTNYIPDYSYYTDMRNHSNIPYQSPQLDNFSQHIYDLKRLVMPSLSSMTLSNDLHSHPPSADIQWIPPSHLLPSYNQLCYVNKM